MSAPRKLLIAGGLALLILSMSYGLWYALFVEHQTLDAMGGALASAFVKAAGRDLKGAHADLDRYSAMEFDHVRRVDAHSHWAGLAVVLIVFGLIFDRVSFSERARLWLAAIFLAGSVIFPLGVVLQTVVQGILPAIVAVLGATLVITTLGLISLGLTSSMQ